MTRRAPGGSTGARPKKRLPFYKQGKPHWQIAAAIVVLAVFFIWTSVR